MNLKEQYESETGTPATWERMGNEFYASAYTQWLEEKANHLENAKNLLSRLANSISTIQLDMGGDHRYMLSLKSHKIITKAKAFLSEGE